MRSHLEPTQTENVQPEDSIANTMLALIPVVPADTSIFVQNESSDPWDECYSTHTAWDALSNPITAVPDDQIGLDNIRRLAEKNYATVIPYNQPVHSAHLLKSAHQLLAGGTVIYTRPGSRRRHLSGLIFHPGNSTLTAHIRGEANPHLGYGRQHGNNKWWEWQFVSRIDPAAMPETMLINQLPIWNHPIFITIRTLIRNEMKNIIDETRVKFSEYAIHKLQHYIQFIFQDLLKKFPKGAFIKPVDSSCSGDFDNVITTQSNIELMVTNFADTLYQILKQLPTSEKIDSPQMRRLLLSQENPVCLVVHDLLFNPTAIIGQQSLQIAKTARGGNFEVRVDFLHGKSIRSMMRYYVADYYPRETKAAADFLDQFFKKSSREEQLLCGGADLALGEDGNWYIIEFNLGAESIGLNFGTYWNRYVSSILGKNTPLIAIYEKIFLSPLSEQIKFLLGLNDTILNHPDIDDIDFVFEWFRDRYCQLFSENPTLKTYHSVLTNLTDLFAIFCNNTKVYTDSLIESANAYMKRELLLISISEYNTPAQTAVSIKYKPTLFNKTLTSAPAKSGTKRCKNQETYRKKRLI